MPVRFRSFSTVALLIVIGYSRPARSQAIEPRFDVTVHVVSTMSSEFDTTDIGVSGRVGWRPASIFGVEGEATWYPGDLPDGTAISRGRVEALFGVTAGPTLGRIRPFARVRPGVVRFQPAPDPIACILIFPPPLGCVLASGRTMFAFDVGGGIEVLPTDRTLVRVDVGDRLVRYPGPSFTSDRSVRTEGFFGHDLRISVGGGLRF